MIRRAVGGSGSVTFNGPVSVTGTNTFTVEVLVMLVTQKVFTDAEYYARHARHIQETSTVAAKA